ncbi:nucleoside-diphosphate sugar epimerase/dehydratase [Alkalihalobacillus sp. BA299]|uniref:polysaccharide biosynthesis protein n=1 Tax=Alkalihalobacillus sp. BA299 TaxID=2815938 RepID=UPI001ADC5E22|nr:nucleoside-diphosphate sugar epimerase/dehydratase [Alkalihalobacillus sp. BA299]
MSYRNRLGLLLIIDSTIVLMAIYVSHFFLNTEFVIFSMPVLLVSSVALLVSHHVFALWFKLYRKAWEYASIGELVTIFKAITLSVIITAIIQIIIFQDLYIRTLLVTWTLHFLLIGGSRFSWRIYRDLFVKRDDTRQRTLVVGAGSAGTMVVRQLLQNRAADLNPVAFIDDDEKKHRLEIMGVPVVAGVDKLEETVNELDIQNVVIAIPSLSKVELNKIFSECSKTKAKTKILPMIEDLMTGKVSVSNFRDVEVEDLLGREPVKLDMSSIAESITNRVILVTGAGGSIGSEICRQVSKFNPAKLVLLGHGENSIYNIELELRSIYQGQVTIETEIADVQDRHKMFAIIDKHQPDVVYHAAAHKHVPLMERNPEEAVKNNIIGTKNIAEAANVFKVQTFVMVSTDKAVNPTSVMGATKRLAEMLVQHMDTVSDNTRFVAVRFGNVLGSRGSVIPLFKKQIQAGGPVTVTHPDMVRYFMTIPEASRLVIQAGALAQGGEIFVLDMGEPVKIVDLAKNLIKLSGYSVDDIGIKFSGIRPGEKMFEELLGKDEVHDEQIWPKIYVGKTATLYIGEINEIIDTYYMLNIEDLRNRLLSLGNKEVAKKEAISV